MTYPSIQELNKILHFRKDGYITAKTNIGKRKIGDRAGYLDKGGYRHIKFKTDTYLEHRIIYFYYYGNIPDGMHIDHINGIKDDNRLENLRLVTPQENRFNNSCKGYSWNKKAKKWKHKFV